MTVKPMIDKSSTSVYINGQFKPPGTYHITKKTTVQFGIRIVGYDGGLLESTSCYVWLLDTKSGKSVWSSGAFNLKKGQTPYFSGNIEVDRSMDLKFQTWYWDNGWKFCDQYGNWNLVMQTQTRPKGYPAPHINRSGTYLTVNGRSVGPGTYYVRKGSEVGINVNIVNQSRYSGNCYVWLIDQHNRVHYKDQFTLHAEYTGASSFVVEEDLILKFQTWVWKNNGWKLYDQYGNWDLKTQTKTHPVIERQNSYVLLNGRRLPSPPCEVSGKSGDTVRWVCSVRNTGGPGKCKLLVWDPVSNSRLHEEIVNLQSGAGKIFAGEFTLKRRTGVKFITYGWDGSNWEHTDDMG